MSISYSLKLFLVIISKSLLILASTWYISYPNKITIISKNRIQKLYAIESKVSKIFFILDPPKSFRQRIWDLKVDYHFAKEIEYASFMEIDS